MVLVNPLLPPAAIVEALELQAVPTLPQERQVAVTVLQVPYTVNTVMCAPDNRWRYRPKYVEQFSRNK